MPTDFSTGLPSSSGRVIGTEHVGTALLELAALDSEKFLPGVEPLLALGKGLA
jgi:hypothetical protein